MNIAEARSHDNGIDFYINSKNITIKATRNEEGNIVVTKENFISPVKKTKTNPLILLAISILFSIIVSNIDNWKLDFVVILVFAWIIVTGVFIIRSKNTKNEQSFRYHAAEHKVFNYWQKHEKLPIDCNDVQKMSSISYVCGSTLIAILLIFVTLSSLGLLFIPSIILKILWVLGSIFITFYLWAIGKCDFFQKLVLRKPTIEEVEVAVCGFCEYIKLKNE